MTLVLFVTIMVAFVCWAYWPRLDEWRRTPPPIGEPREHVHIRCNTCDDTREWHSTTEEDPLTLRHFGACPDCGP